MPTQQADLQAAKALRQAQPSNGPPEHPCHRKATILCCFPASVLPLLVLTAVHCCSPSGQGSIGVGGVLHTVRGAGSR